MAYVVGELAALGLMGGEGLAAGLAFDDAAEQVGAGGAAGVYLAGCLGPQHAGDSLEVLARDDARKGFLHPYRRRVVLGPASPYQCAGVGLVGENPVDGGLSPAAPLGAGQALFVQGLGDVQGAGSLQGQLEDAAHHAVGGWVQFQLGALLSPVLHLNLPVAIGGVGGDPEAPGGGFPHPPQDLLGKIFRVEFVHALDDGLHQLAGGGVVGVLGDGGDPDSPFAEHGLEGHGVLALAGEAGKFPDQNFLERGIGAASLVQHPAELGPVGSSAALGLVNILAGDHVAVLLGVVPERPQLGGHGEVHVLSVTGDPGVEGGRGESCLLIHADFLLCGEIAWNSDRPNGA